MKYEKITTLTVSSKHLHQLTHLSGLLKSTRSNVLLNIVRAGLDGHLPPVDYDGLRPEADATHLVTFTHPPALRCAMEAAANTKGVTKSTLIRWFIEGAFEPGMQWEHGTEITTITVPRIYARKGENHETE